MLEEATGLLEQAKERARGIRAEADAYADARRVEHDELIAQASRARDEATTMIARSRRVLGEAEQELGVRIDQATQSLSKLTEMRRSMSRSKTIRPAAGSDPPGAGDGRSDGQHRRRDRPDRLSRVGRRPAGCHRPPRRRPAIGQGAGDRDVVTRRVAGSPGPVRRPDPSGGAG